MLEHFIQIAILQILTMPTELLKAHKANNRAVMHAYGFSIKMSEADCVAELMRMYQKLTKEK